MRSFPFEYSNIRTNIRMLNIRSHASMYMYSTGGDWGGAEVESVSACLNV